MGGGVSVPCSVGPHTHTGKLQCHCSGAAPPRLGCCASVRACRKEMKRGVSAAWGGLPWCQQRPQRLGALQPPLPLQPLQLAVLPEQSCACWSQRASECAACCGALLPCRQCTQCIQGPCWQWQQGRRLWGGWAAIQWRAEGQGVPQQPVKVRNAAQARDGLQSILTLLW